MCIFLAKYLFWHCCCASWAVQSALYLSRIEWASTFSLALPISPSLFHSSTHILSLREFCLPVCACESYVLNLAPFYVKYIEHSFDIILSIFFCMSSMLLLLLLLLFCLSFSLFVEAFHSNVYRTEIHLCMHRYVLCVYVCIQAMICCAVVLSSST